MSCVLFWELWMQNFWNRHITQNPAREANPMVLDHNGGSLLMLEGSESDKSTLNGWSMILNMLQIEIDHGCEVLVFLRRHTFFCLVKPILMDSSALSWDSQCHCQVMSGCWLPSWQIPPKPTSLTSQIPANCPPHQGAPSQNLQLSWLPFCFGTMLRPITQGMVFELASSHDRCRCETYPSPVESEPTFEQCSGA